MMFFIPPIYIFCSAVLFSKNKWTIKLLLAPIILLATAKTQLYTFIGTDWFSTPDCIPRPILLTMALAYLIAIVFFFLLLLTDAIQTIPILALLAYRRKAIPHFRTFRKVLHLTLLATAAILAICGFSNALQPPQIHRFKIQRQPDDSTQGETTIAFITDLHADPFFNTDRIQTFVDLTNQLQPDFILIGGDCVDGSPDRRPHALDALQCLKPKVATLAVPGNHEYLSDFTAWKPILESYGIQWLENSHRNFPEHGLTICGVSDDAAKRQGLPPPDLTAATASAPPGCSRILLAHRPSIAREAAALPPQQRPLLQLSGHTHGGMFWGFSRLIERFNGGFSKGFYDLDNMKLYVSPGTGIWNGFPIRLGCPAEITLITLTHSQQKGNTP